MALHFYTQNNAIYFLSPRTNALAAMAIDNFLNEVLNFDSLFGFIIGEEEAVASNYKLSYINQTRTYVTPQCPI